MTENYELYHFGILGMKWGVRRYQNPDGTLTEEGKKRYARNIQRTVKSLAGPKKSRTDWSVPREIRSRVRIDTGKVMTEDQKQRLYDAIKKHNTALAEYERTEDAGSNYADRFADYYSDNEKWQSIYQEYMRLHRDAMDRWEESKKEYYAECKKVANELLGDYSDVKAYEFVRDVSIPTSVHELVSDTLERELYPAMEMRR